MCFDFIYKAVSVAGMAVGVTSLRRHQKLPPYKTVLAGSKTDPLQDTAEQIRQAGGTSKGKKSCTTAAE